MASFVGGPTIVNPGLLGQVPNQTPSASTRTPARIPGLVQLWAPETNAIIGARYVEPPQVTAERAANGAWQPVPRLKRVPLSSWSGPQPVKIELKLRFGGIVRVPVSFSLEALRGMQDRLPGDDASDRPPYLLVVGYVPGHYAPVKWQIDGLEIVELDWVGGECSQATATVSLAEWKSADITTTAPAARKAASKKPWLKGDTLSKFAKRHLGSSGKQTRDAIRKANPGIKSWTAVKPKTKITVPAKLTSST